MFLVKLAVKNRIVLIGSVIALSSLVLAALADYIVNPAEAQSTNLLLRLCWNNPAIDWHIQNIYYCSGQTYLLGTDLYGRDLLRMILLSLPVDIGLSLLIVGVSVAIGVLLGSVAAYRGGRTDEAILRVADVFFAFPSLVLAMVIVTRLGRNLDMLALAVTIIWWPLYARLVRSQVLSEKEKPYIEALKGAGAGQSRILFRHILPNSIYPVVVQATLDIGRVILTFSALMFLGFSPSPLLPELGNLTSEGINYVATAPWLIIFPGVTILIIAIGFNLFGDGIRDLLDPRLRR